MSEAVNIVEVKDLKKYFPLKKENIFSKKPRKILKAVDGLNFSVGKGEILGFVGESGCGKSTMSRSIIQLIQPTSGQVLHDGVDLTTLTKAEMRARRKSIQMIFQDPFGSLNPRRSVSETLRMVLKIHEVCKSQDEEDQLIHNVLEEVGLTPVETFWDKFPAMMSGGQLQRVSMARVLMLRPDFIIADEPVSMLDVSVRIGVLDLLLRMRDKYKISFIYITHDLATARYVCDRIAIMYLGRIVEMGPTEEILHNPQHPYTKALIAAVPEPDPSREKLELPIKEWTKDSYIENENACLFFPRCPEGREVCRHKKPEMIDIVKGHTAACHAVHKDSEY